LEQGYDDNATGNVFHHFLLLYQDGGEDVVMDEESDKEHQHVNPCVKQPVLDPNRMFGVKVDDKLSDRRQEDDKPNDGVDDGFLSGLLVVIAHGWCS
jgi:hypothetical protein